MITKYFFFHESHVHKNWYVRLFTCFVFNHSLCFKKKLKLAGNTVFLKCWSINPTPFVADKTGFQNILAQG